MVFILNFFSHKNVFPTIAALPFTINYPTLHAPHRRAPGRQASKTPLFYRSQKHPLPPRSVGRSPSPPRPSHLRDAAADGCEKKRFSLGRALPPAPLAPPFATDPIKIAR
ncbi:MAG: hypothetical protein CL609_22830 [Anaerolineaceae bacterium]|nr:hypothetical protein [Anaerolineaceae bacterium]